VPRRYLTVGVVVSPREKGKKKGRKRREGATGQARGGEKKSEGGLVEQCPGKTEGNRGGGERGAKRGVE